MSTLPAGITTRLPGILYLIVVLTGFFCLAYVPTQVRLADDPTETLRNVMAGEALFRSGIAAFIVMQVAYLLLPLSLYRALKPAGKVAAALMVAFVAVSVPLSLAALAHRVDVLALITEPGLAATLPSAQIEAQVMLALHAYRSGLFLTTLFWGLWLLPLGWLVFHSPLFPRWAGRTLGTLLMLGCAGYLLNLFGDLLIPHYGDGPWPAIAQMPASAGELLTCLWLLAVGIRQPVEDRA
jgi:Domain of unknown function (DUF4386)